MKDKKIIERVRITNLNKVETVKDLKENDELIKSLKELELEKGVWINGDEFPWIEKKFPWGETTFSWNKGLETFTPLTHKENLKQNTKAGRFGKDYKVLNKHTTLKERRTEFQYLTTNRKWIEEVLLGEMNKFKTLNMGQHGKANEIHHINKLKNNGTNEPKNLMSIPRDLHRKYINHKEEQYPTRESIIELGRKVGKYTDDVYVLDHRLWLIEERKLQLKNFYLNKIRNARVSDKITEFVLEAYDNGIKIPEDTIKQELKRVSNGKGKIISKIKSASNPALILEYIKQYKEIGEKVNTPSIINAIGRSWVRYDARVNKNKHIDYLTIGRELKELITGKIEGYKTHSSLNTRSVYNFKIDCIYSFGKSLGIKGSQMGVVNKTHGWAIEYSIGNRINKSTNYVQLINLGKELLEVEGLLTVEQKNAKIKKAINILKEKEITF